MCDPRFHLDTHSRSPICSQKRERKGISGGVLKKENLRDLLLGPNDCYVPPSQPKRRSHSWGALLFKMRADSSKPMLRYFDLSPFIFFYFLRMISNNITLLMIRFGIYKHSLGRCYYIYCTNYYLKFLKKDNPIAFST